MINSPCRLSINSSYLYHYRVISLVLEWAFLHRAELIQNWQLLEKEAPLNKIDPLVQ
jgi:hypothetical protein